jgi:hypothetical protein
LLARLPIVVFGFLVMTTIGCRHRVSVASGPQDTSKGVEEVPGQPDQVNTAGWRRAWTNVLNDVEQSFTPSVPRLTAVEVELVVGNPGAPEDELTLKVLDESNRTLAVVTQTVQSANCDHAIFVIAKDGIELTPGQTYRLKLTGGTTFGWKYVQDGYKNGEATFNGRRLLPDTRSTFLFRTFGRQ